MIEMVLVVAILAALAGLLVPIVNSTQDRASEDVTRTNLVSLRDVILNSYVPDLGRMPPKVRSLLVPADEPTLLQIYDKNTRRGWRGPYFQAPNVVRNTNPNRAGRFPHPTEIRDEKDKNFFERNFFSSLNPSLDVYGYGQVDDPVCADGWGNPIVLQNLMPDPNFIRLVSAGADGELTTDPSVNNPSQANRGDDILLFLKRADVP